VSDVSRNRVRPDAAATTSAADASSSAAGEIELAYDGASRNAHALIQASFRRVLDCDARLKESLKELAKHEERQKQLEAKQKQRDEFDAVLGNVLTALEHVCANN
jgi:hypothetical protein